MRFHLYARTKFHLILGLGCIAVLFFSFFFNAFTGKDSLPITITLLTALGGVTGFLYARHAHDTQLFRELFREFNARYDSLNARLNAIRNRPKDEPLKSSDHDVLFAYFNLCAEEYMFATAGCIDPAVWRAWQKGMCFFDQDPEIHVFWQSELQNDSYYGFRLDCKQPNRLTKSGQRLPLCFDDVKQAEFQIRLLPKPRGLVWIKRPERI